MNRPGLQSSSNEEHMLGHGFYNKHSHEQGKANTCGLRLIIEAINQIDLQRIGGEFRIADYGSAQGHNSLLPMKTAIAQVKGLERRPVEQKSQSQLRTRTCRLTIGRRYFKQFSFHRTAIWQIRATCFASPAPLLFITRFFHRTTSPSDIQPSLNIGSAGSRAISRMKSGPRGRPETCARSGPHKPKLIGTHFCSIARWKCEHQPAS